MNKKGEIGKEGENTSSPYQGEVPACLQKVGRAMGSFNSFSGHCIKQYLIN
jgi:hypothetical protein